MTFSIDTQIKRIEYRINVLRERGEIMNEKIIKALIREKRNLLAKSL